MSENFAPERLPTNRDHFGGSHPPSEANRDDEKAQKERKWLETVPKGALSRGLENVSRGPRWERKPLENVVFGARRRPGRSGSLPGV